MGVKIEAMRELAEMLAGGDRRSIGRADDVVALVAAAPQRFEELWACLKHADGLVRMRAGDTLEKLSRTGMAPFRSHKKELLGGALDDGSAELRWHLIPMAARLTLTEGEAAKLCGTLDERLRQDKSRIVRVAALQAGFELAARQSPACRGFPAHVGLCARL